MIHDFTKNAKLLIRHNFRVFPCRPGEKVPATAHGCKDATDDLTKINGQFGHGENIAIATGDGLFVVDFDETGGVEKLEDRHLSLPSTLAAATPRGGWHYYFRTKKLVKNSQSKLANKVDIRGEGGYVLAAPSVVGGVAYQWLPGCGPDEVEIADAPDWLMALVAPLEPPPAPQAEPAPQAGTSAVERCRKYLQKLPPATSGQGGHNATIEAACTCFRFGLGHADAWGLINEYNATCQPPWSKKELRHKLDDAEKLVRQAGEFGCMIRDDGARRAAPRSQASPAAARVFIPTDPLPTAKSFLFEQFTVNEVATLLHYAGEFLHWSGGAYRTVDGDGVRAGVYEYLNDATTPDGKPFAPNTRRVSDVVDAMKAASYVPPSTVPPCWLGNDAGPSAMDLLAFPNGIVNLRTGNILPPTPRFFCRSALDFNYNPAAPRPALWLNFLSQLWQDDVESIELLQEFFGYCLTADTRQQKALMLIGPKRSGKTTAARILSELVGTTNVGNPTLASLGFPFGLAGLVDKTLAIIGDARIGPHTDAGIVAERLLSIIGEDSIAVDRKYLSTVHLKLPTRFLILSNELPRLSDSSGALSGRMLTLILRETFFNREDTELFAKLKTELPGILLWSIEGWKRLGSRGRFIEPATSASARQDLENLSSPISAFIRDCCRLDDALSAEGQELFDRWRDWCTEQGREHSGTSAIFFRDLRAAAPRLQIRRQRDGLRRSKVYEGIGIRVFGDENN